MFIAIPQIIAATGGLQSLFHPVFGPVVIISTLLAVNSLLWEISRIGELPNLKAISTKTEDKKN